MLHSPLDLSTVSISQAGPHGLTFSSQMTGTRIAFAVLFAGIAVGFLIHAWFHRHSWIEIVWPHLFVIPTFSAIALVVGLGDHRKTVNAESHELLLSARLGPFATSQKESIPQAGTILLTYRKEYPSRGPGTTGNPTMPVRWYDVQGLGVKGFTFTIASNREAAREVAQRLAQLLSWKIDDRVEDDGIERTTRSQ